MIHRAKVVKGASAVPLVAPGESEGMVSHRARVVRHVVVEAERRAQELLTTAEEHVRALVERAEREASAQREQAIEEGRARGYGEVLSRFAALQRIEAAADERGLSRSVELARLLAERLIGASIAVDDDTVTALATQVLSEVRGARQITLYANPNDVTVLQAHTQGSGVLHGLRLVADETCERGNFRVSTDVGTMQANIGVRLDLLTAKLAEALRKGVE